MSERLVESLNSNWAPGGIAGSLVTPSQARDGLTREDLSRPGECAKPGRDVQGAPAITALGWQRLSGVESDSDAER
jgi:hypothetical protein